MSKSGGTLYIGVPHSKFWGTCPPVPQGLRLCLGYVSFAANSFRRTEVKCIRKKTCTLARFWRQRCGYCHNCSEHNNRNCPVSGEITPAEVAGLSWGSVCVLRVYLRHQRQRRQWAWLWRQQASFNFRLTASLLKRPFASAANATSERSISQREHRKTLRNVRVKKRTSVVLVVVKNTKKVKSFQWQASTYC